MTPTAAGFAALAALVVALIVLPLVAEHLARLRRYGRWGS